MRKLFLLLMVCTTMSLAQKSSPQKTAAFPDAAELNKMGARFAPTEMQVDTSSLSAGDKKSPGETDCSVPHC